MDSFINHINSALPDEKKNDILFRFKRKTLDEMNERYKEVSTRGIKNEKVLSDLIISEFCDLPKKYDEFYTKERTAQKDKRRLILNVAGSIIFIFVLIVSYLGISFTTQDWAHTWVIVVDGILLWIAYLLSLSVNRITKLKRIFHIFARILLAIEIMVLTVAVFIFCLAIVHFSKSWVIIIGGIASMLIADGAFAKITKQRLAMMNYLIYIPAIATMLYIILSAVGVLAWQTGWLLIIASLIGDFLIIFASLYKNKKYEQEVIDSWNEN